MKFVSIVLGSKSDYEIMKACADMFESFGVNYEMVISSALRSPQRTEEYVLEAEAKGAQVFIAASGMASHLGGVLASRTIKPIIGVPMSASALSGIDSLLTMVQVPPGMPVATVAIGKAGAINAAFLAMEMMALDNEELAIKLKENRIAKAKKVEMESLEIETRI